MPNTDKSRAAAKTALDAYRELPGFESNDEREALSDLLVDLAHYADTIEDDTTGSYELERALDTYYEEATADPNEVADTSDPFADMEGELDGPVTFDIDPGEKFSN